MFGVDVFGYTNQLFDAEGDSPKEGPSLKKVLSGSAIKEDLGSGGRWSEGGKAFTMLDEDNLYVVLQPDYEVSVVVKDLESGAETTKTASGSMPILQVGGQNAVVRLKSYKTPDGEVFNYSTIPTIGQ